MVNVLQIGAPPRNGFPSNHYTRGGLWFWNLPHIYPLAHDVIQPLLLKHPRELQMYWGFQWLPPLHLCTAPAPGNQTLLRASLGSCLWTRSCLGRSWNIRSETTFDLLSLLCRASRRVCRSFILQKNHPRKLWSVPRHYRHPLQNKLIGITFSGENPVCATTRIITIC